MINERNMDLKSLDKLGNILFDEKECYCSIKISTRVFSLEAIKFAAHHLAEEVNVLINAPENETILIEAFLKDKTKSIKDFVWKFNETLIAYATYLIQSDRNRELREAILKKALFVTDCSDHSKTIPD